MKRAKTHERAKKAASTAAKKAQKEKTEQQQKRVLKKEREASRVAKDVKRSARVNEVDGNFERRSSNELQSDWKDIWQRLRESHKFCDRSLVTGIVLIPKPSSR